MSRDWLRHSTVDRRTLRPLSMVHVSPCQQPCRPTARAGLFSKPAVMGEEKEHTEPQMEMQLEMDHKMRI